MCNRYQLRASIDDIRHSFGVTRETYQPTLPGEFFPGSTIPIIKAAGDGRELAEADWGIQLGKYRVTNSRDDKLQTWGRFMSRRVIIPLNRAVEYRYPIDLLGQPNGKPTPWVLYPADESIAAIAGISDQDGAVSMMTTKATGLAAEVHNKKPADPRIVVFLTEPKDVKRWLDPEAGRDDVVDLLRPPPDGRLAGEPLRR
jgi:putative SOS response-associated peptidase YedK